MSVLIPNVNIASSAIGSDCSHNHADTDCCQHDTPSTTISLTTAIALQPPLDTSQVKKEMLSVTPPAAASISQSAPASSSTSASPLVNSNPLLVDPDVNDTIDSLPDPELDTLRDEIYSLIRHIHDPEHDNTIEELGVVYKLGVVVSKEMNGRVMQEYADIEFKPTVPHCSLATLIGLCIRTKVLSTIPNIKLSIHIKPGAHQTEHEITRQLNDKERATAALENPALRETVDRLIKDRRE